MLLSMGLNIYKTSLGKERLQPRGLGERESSGNSLPQARHILRYDFIDLMIIGALHHGIHRDRCTPPREKHATKLRQTPHRVGEEHQPEIA